MKFRARLQKESVQTIHSVTSTLQKIGSTAAVFLNQECIRIAVITESPDMPKCYSELDSQFLFPDDYRIESQSGNTILFEIGLEHLTRALASGRNATHSQFKLVKRGMTPCLCYEAKDSDSLAVSVNIKSSHNNSRHSLNACALQSL
jgi:Hus1-like protein